MRASAAAEARALDGMLGKPLHKVAREFRKERARKTKGPKQLTQKQNNNRSHWVARKAKIAALYAWYVQDLGGYCGASCTDPELGCGGKTGLQLHHNEGSEWTHNRVGPLRRIYLYTVDWLTGKLGVLCGACNQHDGATKQKFYQAKAAGRDEHVPF